jgi:thiol-disulfide isomerase/thioredoxin
MPNPRYTITPFAFVLCLIAGLASAGNRAAYDQAAFDAAQKAGKPILVEVTAPWCPVCKAQAPILNDLRGQPEFKDLQTFTIDFDSQKDLLRAFKVSKQSTLIVFKGATEVGRSTGDTNPVSIEALVAKSL